MKSYMTLKFIDSINLYRQYIIFMVALELDLT